MPFYFLVVYVGNEILISAPDGPRSEPSRGDKDESKKKLQLVINCEVTMITTNDPNQINGPD